MPKERNKADGYREKAYEGDTKAMNNLGVCYERGTGVKVNLEMAFEWYMKAAELGDVYGCFNVGECYYHGKGVEQNAEQAFEWYMKAADKGDAVTGQCGQCLLSRQRHGAGSPQGFPLVSRGSLPRTCTEPEELWSGLLERRWRRERPVGVCFLVRIGSQRR